MSNMYVIADTHFSHARIIKIAGRPFHSVQEMDNTILENINRVVERNDTLIHLGDVGLCPKDKMQWCLAQIRCRNKILIMGNHDRARSPQAWRELGFKEVSLWPIIYDEWYIMCHEPLYLEVNSPFAVIHGHTHQNSYTDPEKAHYFNASVERIGYEPVLLDEIKEMLTSGRRPSL
jgi:calcineurin-like phosphoesterase family protein